MANTKTVAQMLANARALAGVEGMDDRHPDATLIIWLNDVWREMRTRLANIGIQGLTIPTNVASLPTAPPTNEAYLEVPLPDGAVGIYGLDVLIGQEWVPLRPGSFAQRRDYQRVSAAQPLYWLTLQLPTESTTTITAGKLMVFPAATNGLSYRIWYLPTWVNITNTTHVLYGHDTWHEWAVNGLARKIAQKDNDAQGTLDECARRQAEVWVVIKKGAESMNLAEPIQRVRAGRRRRDFGRSI